MTFPCRNSLSFTGRLVFCFVLTNKHHLPNNFMPRVSLRNSLIQLYMTNWECDWIVWSRNWQSFPICLFLTYFEKLTKYIYSLIRALLIFRPMRLWGLKAWQNFSPVLWVFFGKRGSVGKRITGSIESLCHKKWAALFQRATERQGNFWLPIFSTLDALFLDSSFFTFLRSWTKSLAESSSALGRWTRCDGSPTLSQTTWLRQSGPIS